jgi:hypothetical protein
VLLKNCARAVCGVQAACLVNCAGLAIVNTLCLLKERQHLSCRVWPCGRLNVNCYLTDEAKFDLI